MRSRILISIQLFVVLLITVITNGNDADFFPLISQYHVHAQQARNTFRHQRFSRKRQHSFSFVKIKTRFRGSDISYPANFGIRLYKNLYTEHSFTFPRVSFVYRYVSESYRFRGPPAV
ncbi:MAG: hypothetical protein ACTHJ0_11580 [Flavipsychrobacter sp.]